MIMRTVRPNDAVDSDRHSISGSCPRDVESPSAIPRCASPPDSCFSRCRRVELSPTVSASVGRSFPLMRSDYSETTFECDEMASMSPWNAQGSNQRQGRAADGSPASLSPWNCRAPDADASPASLSPWNAQRHNQRNTTQDRHGVLDPQQATNSESRFEWERVLQPNQFNMEEGEIEDSCLIFEESTAKVCLCGQHGEGDVDCEAVEVTLSSCASKKGTTLSIAAANALSDGTCAISDVVNVQLHIQQTICVVPCIVSDSSEYTIHICAYGRRFLKTRCNISVENSTGPGRATRGCRENIKAKLSTDVAHSDVLLRSCKCRREVPARECLALRETMSTEEKLEFIHDVRQRQSELQDKSIAKWLFGELQMYKVLDDTGAVASFDTRVRGLPCCPERYRLLYGISRPMWYNVVTDIKAGCGRVRTVKERLECKVPDAQSASVSALGMSITRKEVQAFIHRDLLSMSEKADPKTGKRMCVRPNPERQYKQLVALFGPKVTWAIFKKYVKATVQHLSRHGWQFRRQHQFTKCDDCVRNDERHPQPQAPIPQSNPNHNTCPVV